MNGQQPEPETAYALIPHRVAPPLLVAGGACLGIGLFHPQGTWFSTAGGVLLFLGGWGLKMPRMVRARPLVPLALVPSLMFAANLLEGPVAQHLPAQWHVYAAGAAGVLKFLCGLVAPNPTLASEEKPAQE